MSTIYFTLEAMAKLKACVDLADGEVSGLGKVEQLGKDFLVSEVVLIEQESSWGSTVLDDEALAGFLKELISKGDDPSLWRLWWHSHGWNKPFYSKEDEKTCKRFDNEWMLSIVTSKRGECIGRIDVYRPIHLCQELPVRVYLHLPEEELAKLKKELREKVRKPARRWWDWSGRYPYDKKGEGEDHEYRLY